MIPSQHYNFSIPVLEHLVEMKRISRTSLMLQKLLGTGSLIPNTTTDNIFLLNIRQTKRDNPRDLLYLQEHRKTSSLSSVLTISVVLYCALLATVEKRLNYQEVAWFSRNAAILS